MAQNIMVSAIILEFLQSFEFTDALLQMGQVVNVTLEDGKGKESSKSEFSPQIILHKGDKRKGIYNLLFLVLQLKINQLFQSQTKIIR